MRQFFRLLEAPMSDAGNASTAAAPALTARPGVVAQPEAGNLAASPFLASPATAGTERRGGPRPSVLSLNINSKSGLYAAYMPLLRNGGIFIPTARHYALGDEVFMLLSLMDDPAKLPIAGSVVWITPVGAQNSKAQGIGVHFKSDESGVDARRKIEVLLGGVMQSSRPTHTI
jgi:type IV pilus assembly protein PilZ